MRRVLVTGAGGFVGRVSVRSFLAAGWHVRAAVRRVPADAEADAEWLAVGDIERPGAWQGVAEGVHCVVHLAARAHVLRDTARDPIARFRSANVDAAGRLAIEAVRAGVKRFVFLSSVGVNGQRTDAVSFREVDPPQPSSAYALSKWEAEQMLIDFARRNGMEYAILRAPLVYGPQAPGNFRRLVNWVHRGWPLPFATVSNKRSMVFVENLVDALKSCITHPAAANELFLVADRQSISTPELVRLLAQALGRPARLWPVPVWLLRWGERITAGRLPISPLLDSLVVDTTRIEKHLQWIPPYSLQEGLLTAVAGVS